MSRMLLRFAPPAAVLMLALAACGGSSPTDSADPDDNGRFDAPAAADSPDAIPTRFRGTWDESAEACAGPPGEAQLRVEADRLRFHESVARVASAQPGIDGSIQLHLAFEGEGESWREPRTLRLLADGSLVVEGPMTADTRVRCGAAPEVPEAVTAAPPRWWAAPGAEGAGLFLEGPGGERRVTLFCLAGSGDLLVNVPDFRPVGSEERMAFGSGGTVATLVADPTGDRERGGVTGTGRVPRELAAILRGPAGIGVNYGAQDSGPHPPPPPDLARTFLEGCGG